MTMNTALILHDIRSAYNVGAIFRTADAIGVNSIYLTGFTPLPVDRFGFFNKQIAKTALGAEQTVHWEHHPNVEALINQLKGKTYTLIGLEIDPRAIDYKTYQPTDNIAVLLGGEVKGIDPVLRALCDVLLALPMKGEKESLNVSVAAGVLLYQLLDR